MSVIYLFTFLLKKLRHDAYMSISLGWRTWCVWWDESVRCSGSNSKQSTNFTDVDWWKGLYLLLLFIIHILELFALSAHPWFKELDLIDQFDQKISKLAGLWSGLDLETGECLNWLNRSWTNKISQFNDSTGSFFILNFYWILLCF